MYEENYGGRRELKMGYLTKAKKIEKREKMIPRRKERNGKYLEGGRLKLEDRAKINENSMFEAPNKNQLQKWHMINTH